MASYKMHIALVRQMPPIEEAAARLREHGVATDHAVGVTDIATTSKTIQGKLTASRTLSVPQVVDENGTAVVNKVMIKKDTLIPFLIRWDGENVTAEMYAGGNNALGCLLILLKGACGKNDLSIEPIAIDPMVGFRKVQQAVPAASLVSATLPSYMPDHRAIGSFTAKFSDTAQGVEFLDEQDDPDEIKSVRIRLKAPNGKMGLAIGRTSTITFSGNEDDHAWGQAVVRGICGIAPMPGPSQAVPCAG
jgi:hypothetical protein